MNIFKKISNVNSKFTAILIVGLMVGGLFALFPAGKFNLSTQREEISEQIAQFCVNDTIDGEHGGVVVEPKDDSDKIIDDSYSEFLGLYGAFGGAKAYYAGVVNGNKKIEVKIESFNYSSNLSFLYVDHGFSNKYIDDPVRPYYRHEYYPIDLMFKGDHIYVPGCYSFIYISQSQADALLKSEGKIKPYTDDDYLTVIGHTIDIKIDGTIYKYYVEDIYYERDIYYSMVSNLIGDFFIGYNKYPEPLTRQAMFFMNSYPFQNNFLLNYAYNKYSINDFDYEISIGNVKSTSVIDNSIFNKAFNSVNEAPCYIFLTISIILVLFSLLIFWFGSFYKKIINVIILFIGLLIPYLIFFVIYQLTHNVFMFSQFSTIAYLILILLIFIVVFLRIIFYKRELMKKEHANEETIV